MWQGLVESIHIARAAATIPVEVAAVRAVRGRGLDGDRYFLGVGTYSTHPGSGRDVTLIEAETLEALQRELRIVLAPGASRRNIVTRGVALNHLVGQRFRVGEVLLEGMRLCEPCAHLEELTQRGVLAGLVHRGGLRTVIVEEGTMHRGDIIRPADE
jgi:MOSC domain-containing protein YiiM